MLVKPCCYTPTVWRIALARKSTDSTIVHTQRPPVTAYTRNVVITAQYNKIAITVRGLLGTV